MDRSPEQRPTSPNFHTGCGWGVETQGPRVGGKQDEGSEKSHKWLSCWVVGAGGVVGLPKGTQAPDVAPYDCLVG